MRSRLALAALLLFAPATVSGQDAGPAEPASSVAELEGADPFTRAEDDPIGADAAEEQLLRSSPLPEPEDLVERAVPVREGAALTAIAGVREASHAVEVELVSGLLVARVEQTFTSSARHPAEVSYRLAVPAGAALVALEVCNDAGCRSGAPDRSSGLLSAYDDAARARGASSQLPIAHARLERDPRGEAIVVRAAPVWGPRVFSGAESTTSAPARDLVVRTTWAVHAPIRGGALRVTLPARGLDARAAETRLSVRALDVVSPEVDGTAYERRAMTRAPEADVLITARVPSTAGTTLSADVFPCGSERCVRARAVGARPRPSAMQLVLAIDASPSTTHSARGRIAPAARVLLRELPEGSEIRVVAFASRAEEVAAWGPPEAVEDAALREAVSRDLGSATRLDALVDLLAADAARRELHVVVVGDGGLTEGARSERAIQTLVSRGITLSTLAVADRPVGAALVAAVEATGGVALAAGREADDAAAERGTLALRERVTTVIAPTVARTLALRDAEGRHALGALRQGEEVTLVTPLRGRSALEVAPLRAAAREPASGIAAALSALYAPRALVALANEDAARLDAGSCRARGRYASSSAVVPRDVPLALAHARRCDTASDEGTMLGVPAAERERGLPARALLASLRRRVIPAARMCFRVDRHGRGAYQVRAVPVITLADLEVTRVEIGGELGDELRTCLEQAFERLEVPAFGGTIVARWPLYTEAHLPPPTLELAPDVADRIDALAPRDE